MKPKASPPRLALWLLRLSVPRRWDLSVVGDLEEEWRLRQSGALSRSPLSLRWWFAKQALSVCSGFLRHRARQRLGRLWGRFGGRSPDPGQASKSKERLSESLRQDLSLAMRLMARNPGFTLVTVLTLGLGIGANTAIFSVVNGVLLRPFPYPAPHKMIHISALLMEGGLSFGGNLAESHFKALRQRSRSLEALSFYTSRTLQLSGIEEPRVVAGARVSAGFFAVMGIAPIRGRGFLAREEQPGGPAAAVISYGLWQSLFGGRQDVLGRRLSLDEEECAIVGVASPQLRFPSDTQVWLPYTLDPQHGGAQNPVIARISEGAELEQARAEIEGIVLTAWEEEGAITDQARITLTSFYERAVGAIRPALMAFFAAVMVVLLIACANVAHLMLARSGEREREFAVRAALGAGRMRLARQLLVESSLLSGTGAGLGLLGAYWAVRAFVAFSPGNVPRLDEVRIDVGVLAFTLALAVLTGIAFGLLPALRAARPRLGDALQEGHHSSGGPHRTWLRGLLVVGEVSSALVLLVAAGLLIRSFALLMAVDPGYDPRQVLVAQFQPSQARYPGGSEKLRLYRNLVELARSHDRIESAAFGSHAPMVNRWFLANIRVEGSRDPSASGQVFWQVVSPDYFRTLRIPLLEGRRLSGNDDRDSVDVVILNRRLAREHFGQRSPLGQIIHMGRDQRPLLVVGVVGDAQPNQLSNSVPPILYLPALQIDEQNIIWNMGMSVIVRVAPGEDPADFAPLLAGQARSLDPNLLPTETASLESRLSRSAAQPRFYASLAGLFGAAALLLVSVGIYGVVSYFVSRRTHEIAVRMALGARPGHVLRTVLGRGMSLVGAGTALGLAGALATARLLSSQLFGITSSDAATYAAVALFLMGVALLACYLPARRATRADPLEALRSE
ncbi:MAG: ABC transporter permease [Acidobacteriota bacterium]